MFAMWTLPIAWGASWRYITTGRCRAVAAIAVVATIAAHFMTGYLALIAIVVWVAIAPVEVVARLRRGAILLTGVALGAAWVVYPLIHYGTWASQNEFLQHTGSADSYGARQVLRWLVTGNLFDATRFPVITLLAAAGLGVCCWRAKWTGAERAIAAIFILSVLLFFGRPTFGAIIDLLPGSHDLFLRRFLMGVHLAALYLAGVGAVALKDGVVRFARARPSWRLDRLPRRGAAAIAGAIVIAVLAPAWTQIASFDAADAADIAYQQRADATTGSDLAVIVTQLHVLGPGRVYAGLPAPRWGGSFTVGDVPVFKYLSNLDFDMVGYTLRTASLMTDPEEYFDETNAGDYAIFGIKYLVLPTDRAPVPQSTLVLRSGPFSLWEIVGADHPYVQVGSTQGSIVADRTNIGLASENYLSSELPNEHLFKPVAFAGTPAARDTVESGATPPPLVGHVTAEQDNLDRGRVSATITVHTRAVVALSASFDPGWRATVDGRPVVPYMVAPALVAVTVPSGSHEIVFQYRGYAHYPELFALAALGLIGLGVGNKRCWSKIRRAGAPRRGRGVRLSA
jgi:hypothetical protein